jgi:serine/threonine protein kinase
MDLSAQGELPAGHLVADRYRVQGLLGRGGVGVVYAVLDEHLARKAALKLLLTTHAGNAQLVERFQREARIAASIAHPGIVEMYERGAHAGLLYLVMEYLEGENLESRLERLGPLPSSFVARVGNDLCSALAAAHERDIIHRDIKPSNVFLAESGDYYDIVKVLDFGLAKLHEGERLTRSNQVFGTVSYMPPEQLTSSTRVGPAADVYAIGCVLYELLAGRPPFVAASQAALGLAILQDPPPPLRAQRPEVPSALAAVIERALQKLPTARFRDAGEMADALYPIAESLGELTPPRRPRRSVQPHAVTQMGPSFGDLQALASARTVAPSSPQFARAEQVTLELPGPTQTPPTAQRSFAQQPSASSTNAWSVAESERPSAPLLDDEPGHKLGGVEAIKTVLWVALGVMAMTLALVWLFS